MSRAKGSDGMPQASASAAGAHAAAPRGQWIATAVALAAVLAVLVWPDDKPAWRDTPPVADRGELTMSRSPARGGGAEVEPPAPPLRSSAATPRFELVTLGEIAIGDDYVERTYAVRVVNDATWRPDAAVEVGTADLRITVVDGRAELGDLAPEAARTSVDKLTLRHAAGLRLDADRLQWRLVVGEPSWPKGTLLAGAPDRPAIEAVRDFDARRVRGPEAGVSAPTEREPPGLGLMAVIAAETATVEDVNRALVTAHAAIVEMRPNVPTLALTVHGPRDAATLDATLQRLRASSAFAWVWPGASAGHAGFADAIPPPDPEPEFDDHRPR